MMKDQEVNLKEISLEALEHFKKNDYLKLFKKKTTWKKKRLLFLLPNIGSLMENFLLLPFPSKNLMKPKMPSKMK